MTQELYNKGFETERLVTRPLAMTDLSAWTTFFEDRDCVEFFPNPGHLSPPERAKQWIERQQKRYDEGRFGLQALIDKKTNAFVGQCGLLSQEVDGKPELEVGYHVFKQHWGKGYAPEAAVHFKDLAFQNSLADSVVSIIHADNARSQKVALKNGMQRGPRTNWMDIDVYIYRTHQ